MCTLSCYPTLNQVMWRLLDFLIYTFHKKKKKNWQVCVRLFFAPGRLAVRSKVGEVKVLIGLKSDLQNQIPILKREN